MIAELILLLVIDCVFMAVAPACDKGICPCPDDVTATFDDCCVRADDSMKCAAFCNAHSDPAIVNCVLLTCEGYAECCSSVSSDKCKYFCEAQNRSLGPQTSSDCMKVLCDGDGFEVTKCCPLYGTHPQCCSNTSSDTCREFCLEHPTEGECIKQAQTKCSEGGETFEKCCEKYSSGSTRVGFIFHPVCDDYCQRHANDVVCIDMNCQRSLNTATCCPVFNLSIPICGAFCLAHKTSGECFVQYNDECNANKNFQVCCDQVGLNSSICNYFCQSNLNDLDCQERAAGICRTENTFEVCCENYEEICNAWCENNPKVDGCILLKGEEAVGPVVEAKVPDNVSVVGPLILIIVLGIVFIVVSVVIFFFVLYYLKLGCFEAQKDDGPDIETGVNEIMASVTIPDAIDLKDSTKTTELRDTSKTADLKDTKSATDGTGAPSRKSARKSRKSVKTSDGSAPSKVSVSVSPKPETTTTATRKSVRKSTRKSVKK